MSDNNNLTNIFNNSNNNTFDDLRKNYQKRLEFTHTYLKQKYFNNDEVAILINLGYNFI